MINTEIISKLRYSFGIVYWSKTILNKIDTMILSYIEDTKLKYKGTTKWRYYLPTKELGLGLKSVKVVYLQELVNLKKELNKKEDIREIYKSYEESICKSKRITEQIIGIAKSLEINTDELTEKIANEDETNKWIQQEAYKYYVKQWVKLQCAGYIYKELNKEEIDKKATTNAWKNLGFNDQKLGTVMAFQEKVTTIGSRLAKCTKNERMTLCYRCHEKEETILHVLSSCSGRRGDYIKRHDRVGIVIYQAALKKFDIIKTKITEPITINCEKYSIIWNQQITSKQKGCQPDLTIINKEKKYGILIDIAIVNTNRMNEAYKSKIDTYKDTSVKIKQEKELNSIRVIPVIISNDGLIYKQTTALMEEVGIKVDWDEAIREVLHINQEIIIRCYSKRGKWRERGRQRKLRQRQRAGVATHVD